MATGLRGLLGLPEPTPSADALSGPSQAFRESFRTAIDQVNETLRMTAAHARVEEHKAIVSQRDNLYAAFHKVLEKYSSGVESETDRQAERVVAAANALGEKAVGLSRAAEQQQQRWAASEVDFAEIVAKVAELEEANHEKSGTLRKLVESIQENVNSHKFDEALRVVAQISRKVERFHGQFAANTINGPVDVARPSVTSEPAVAIPTARIGTAGDQQENGERHQYDVNLASIQDRLGRILAATPDDPLLHSIQHNAIELRDAMEQEAAEGNYVAANETLHRLDEVLDEYEKQERLPEDKEKFDVLRKSIEKELSRALRSKPKGEIGTILHAKIIDVDKRTRAAAGSAEYVQATKHVEMLPPLLKSWRDATEVEPQLSAVTAEHPVSAAAKETKKRIIAIGRLLKEAASKGDVAVMANRFEEAKSLLNKYNRAEEEEFEHTRPEVAKAGYEVNRKAIDARLTAILKEKPLGEKPAIIQSQIRDLKAKTDETAKRGEYALANTLIVDLLALLGDFWIENAKIQSDARATFESTIKPIVDQVWMAIGDQPNKARPFDKATTDARAELLLPAMRVAKDVVRGDYLEANKHGVQLTKLLNSYKEARAKYNNLVAKTDVEARFPTFKNEFEKFKKSKLVAPELQNQYDAVAAGKKAVETAIRRKDFPFAQSELDRIEPLWEKFYADIGKEKDPAGWLALRLQALHVKIDLLYTDAEIGLLQRADNYDEAIKLHRKTIDQVLKQKGAEFNIASFLVDLFFVALASGVGGALAQRLKAGKKLKKTLKDLATAGGIDSSKDVVKHFVKFAGKKFKSSPNPLKEFKALDSDGVQFARDLGKRIGREKKRLLEHLLSMHELLKSYVDKDRHLDLKAFGLDEDPVDALSDSTFAEVMRGLGEPTVRQFSQHIWATWIEKHALKIKVRTTDTLHKGLEYEYYIDDSLFEYMNLYLSMVNQAGDASMLNKQIEEARVRAWKEHFGMSVPDSSSSSLQAS